MTELQGQADNGLAIASFVLMLVGIVLCFTVIGAFFGVLCLILALILGIVAIVKKQTKWAARLGTILSAIVLLVLSVVIVFVSRFVLENKESLITPIYNFSSWAEENPNIVDLLKDESFSEKFEELFESRMQDKYGEDYENVENQDDLLSVWGDLFEEMKSVASDLAEGYEVDNSLLEKDNEELMNE